ncbi:MAG: hypothetical protein ACREQJ_11315 [Candidatus Binatia bacterium]
MIRAVFVLGCALAAACAQTVPSGRPVVTRVDLAELAVNPVEYRARRVSFSATVERVEETSQGIWLHLSEGETKLPLYVRLSFGGAVKAMLGSGKMEFEVEVGEKILTPLGQTALEITPYLISQTRYFDQPIPLETPVDGSR